MCLLLGKRSFRWCCRTISASESRRIFVGVDCFGRGCPGGGGFNTKEALGLILEASVGAAIYSLGPFDLVSLVF